MHELVIEVECVCVCWPEEVVRESLLKTIKQTRSKVDPGSVWHWQVGLLWAVYNSFVSRGHGKENRWKGVSAAASHKWSRTFLLNGADSKCVTFEHVSTFNGVTFHLYFRRVWLSFDSPGVSWVSGLRQTPEICTPGCQRWNLSETLLEARTEDEQIVALWDSFEDGKSRKKWWMKSCWGQIQRKKSHLPRTLHIFCWYRMIAEVSTILW